MVDDEALPGLDLVELTVFDSIGDEYIIRLASLFRSLVETELLLFVSSLQLLLNDFASSDKST